jgi:hypothetical protein
MTVITIKYVAGDDQPRKTNLGLRLIIDSAVLPPDYNEDLPGEIHIVISYEGIIIDLVDCDGEIAGTSSETFVELIERIANR